eukprot:gene2997-13011_t
MVWFICGDCGDSIKKPKLQNHFYQCGSYCFSCVDCSTVFDRQSAQKHAQCVTEHQKYALGATKPGGFAANGFKSPEGGSSQAVAGEASGLEFLSKRPPWKCSVCNIGCTSEETLMAHAAGVKHGRRARAATAAAGGGGTNGTPAAGNGTSASNGGASCPVEEPTTTTSEPEAKAAKDSGSKAEKTKKSKKKGSHPCLEDKEKFAKLAKVISKKLSSKGKVSEKKLKALKLMYNIHSSLKDECDQGFGYGLTDNRRSTLISLGETLAAAISLRFYITKFGGG